MPVGIDILIVMGFLVVNLLLGILNSGGIKTLNQFSVGHRNFGTFAIFATLSASFIGGGYTLGNAAKVYQGGMVLATALLGFSLKEILVGSLIAPRMNRFRDCISVGDVIARNYGEVARVVTGLFAIIVCSGILGAQVGSLGAIFSAFFEVGVLESTLVSFLIIIAYCTLGGMKAVVYTDILQFAVLIVGLPLVFVLGTEHAGGWQALVKSVPAGHLLLLPESGQWGVFIPLFLTFMMGETLVPPYTQRLFMAADARITRNATVLSGLVSIPFFLVVGGCGLTALVLNPGLPPDQALPWLVRHILPAGVVGFVISALVAVIMSSAAGFLNAASVSFVNDIVRPLSRNRLSELMLLLLAKLATVCVGLGAVGFSLYSRNMLDVLLYAYNFWAPVVLVPLLAVFFGVSARPSNFIAGAMVGVICMLLWSTVLEGALYLSPVVAGVCGNGLSFFLSSFFLSRSR